MVPPYTEVQFFEAQFMTMQEKQILVRAIGIKKETWG